MTKTDLIDHVSGECAISKVDSKKALEVTFSAIANSLTTDGRFSYHGFGTFTVRDRAARMGRNPHTGETISIAASKTVKFKPAGSLKDSL